MQHNAQDSHEASAGLEQAYQQYRQELRRFFALNSRDRQNIDDLMQMMYLQLLQARTREEVREPQRYLFRTAWNVLHSANRRARVERQQVMSADVEGLGLWVEDDTGSALQHDELERALKQLPRVCQVALLRQYRDNCSYKEIAEELGVTVHAVKKYVMRALNHLRMHFNSAERER